MKAKRPSKTPTTSAAAAAATTTPAPEAVTPATPIKEVIAVISLLSAGAMQTSAPTVLTPETRMQSTAAFVTENADQAQLFQVPEMVALSRGNSDLRNAVLHGKTVVAVVAEKGKPKCCRLAYKDNEWQLEVLGDEIPVPKGAIMLMKAAA